MTIAENFGKFKAKIVHHSCIGSRNREVEFDLTWVSCGVFQAEYNRPKDADPYYVMVVEDWYPPNTHICFTPEQFEKVFELYPAAPKHARDKCYQPFYEDYDLDRGMFDFSHDTLFQAFKDPHTDVEMVHMVTHHFVKGVPSNDTGITHASTLGLYWEDFLKLKELIDSKKDQIFYSGCKIAMPSKIMNDLAACVPK